jgi:elongation factor G
VPLDLQAAIREAVKDALEVGGVLGFPLVQVRATILRADVRPEEGTLAAFQAACALAVGGALEAAGAIILEPVMRFEIQVPDPSYGPVATDLERRRAQLEASELTGEMRILKGRVPLAEVFGYPGTLRSLTQGRGSITLEPDIYLPVPPEDQGRFLV